MWNITYVVFLVGISVTFCIQWAVAQDDASTLTDSKDGMARQLFDNEVFSSHLVMVDQLPITTEEGQEAIHSLAFSPSTVDFERVAIGEPASKKITVFNRHKNQSVHLGSIMGNVPDFYTSYFSHKVIPPEGNATFNIVFLPRRLGKFPEHTVGALMIHTTFGLIKYEVRGEGIECPYRLRPLVNIKVPLNATISPEILMYNPYNTPLQILEVYSSGGAFQLELPSGAQEGPQALWEIEPFATKSVIRIKFNAKTEGNHTAYVRIKIATSADPELRDRMLVVPVEVEVCGFTGVYASMPFIDFGMLTIGDRTLERSNISLLNSGKAVDLKSWNVEADDSEVKDCMTVTYHPNDSQLQLIVNWSKISQSKHITGYISINYTVAPSSVTHNYRIPFTGQLVKGEISYDTTLTHFLVTHDGIGDAGGGSTDDDDATRVISRMESRVFQLKNNFSLPLLVTNVTVPQHFSRNFRIFGFIQPLVIPPNEMRELFNIALTNATSASSLIHVHTNVSVYEVPVHCFNGRIKRIVPLEVSEYDEKNAMDEGEINFGILPVSMSHQVKIAFVNTNPVPVKVTSYKARTTAGTVYLVLKGCGDLVTDSLYLCDEILPQQWIVFGIEITAPTVGSYSGKFILKTEIAGKAMEEIVTPIKFTTAYGRLEIKKELLHFTDCYPGKSCSLNLSAYSTFLKKMRVEGISVETYGITYVCSEYPEISPNVDTDIGRLLFDPKDLCKNDCYTSFEILSNKTAAKWMSTLNNFQAFSALDQTWLAYRQNLYASAKKLLKSISFRLTTSQVRRYEFNATVNFIWPKFLPSNINFPTLQIDQEAVKFITIANPTDHLLLVHYVLHDVGVHGMSMYTPPSVSKECTNCTLSEDRVFTFLPPHETEVFIQDIPPHSYAKIGIRFTANEPGTYSTVLYLRNNLTVVESVWITARAVVPQFRFGNRKSGSTTPLLFEVTDKHLKACEKPQSASKPFVSIKRSFTARNQGEVPITVYSSFIEDQQCTGFGYKVLNCQAFELSPNSTNKVDIEFSPDFTLARVQRTLYLHTSAGYSVNFTLLGTIPPYALETCSKAIIRPDWEATYRKVAAIVLVVLFLFITIWVFYDADRILREHRALNMARDRGPIQPPLDLKQIATSLQQENASTPPKPVVVNHQVTVKQKRKSDPVKVNNAKPVVYGAKEKESTLRNRRRQQRQQEIMKQKKEAEVEVEETESTTTESSFNSSDDDSKHTNNSRSSPKEMVVVETVQVERRTKQPKHVAAKRRQVEPKNSVKGSTTPEPVEKKVNGVTHNNKENITSSEERIENIQNDSSIGIAKSLGKTPGRERHNKNHQNAVNKNTAKALSFNNKNNPFQFEAPFASGLKAPMGGQTHLGNHLGFMQTPASSASHGSNSNIWSTANGGATFSDVVSQHQLPDLVKPVMSKPSKSQLDMPLRRSLPHQDQTTQNAFARTMDSGYMKTPVAKRNSADLGPIGQRRRSPNTNWEPLGAAPGMLPKPTPTLPTVFSNRSQSRFLDSFLHNRSAEQVALMGQDPSSPSYSYFDDQNFLLALYQQQQQQQQAQLQQQQQQLQQQQQQHQQQFGNGGWNNLTQQPSWTPMGYTPAYQQPQQQQQQPITHQMTSQSSNMWSPPPPQPTTTIRPPPGLSHQNVLPQPQPQPEEEMRTYDPFKSLSYLWQGDWDNKKHQ